MEQFEPRNKHGPEWRIQKEFVRYLQDRNWHVERMVGNAYQTGIPDIYAMHIEFGQRWIDLKNPVSYEFTAAQRRKWPIWAAYGTPIWIITCNDDYPKLFEPPNWRKYWKEKYNMTNEKAMEDL